MAGSGRWCRVEMCLWFVTNRISVCWKVCVAGIGKLKDRLSSFPVLADEKYLSVYDCVEYAGDNTDC